MTLVIACVADLHIANHRAHGGAWTGGLNVRGQETIDGLGNALSIAEASGASRMILLGDVFDTTKPDPQLIAGAQHMINAHLTPVRVLKGNHDEGSSAPGDHALGPLGETANVEVYETKHVEQNVMHNVDVIYLPFETGAAKDWLPKRLDEIDAATDTNRTRILCLHLGIHDQQMRNGGPASFWIEKSDDAISAELLAAECYKRNIRAVFAGNWHGRRIMEFSFPPNARGLDTVTLVQVGALTPTGWDNPGLEGYGGVALAKIDPDGTFELSFGEIPGPRFVNVKSTDELDLAVAEANGNRLYVRWHAKPTEVAHAREELARYEAVLTATDITINKEETQAMAREAATAAQSTTTLAAVLDSFVSKMPMPETVNRERVFNRCKVYIG